MPPLLPPKEEKSYEESEHGICITILGYDPNAAELGIQLVRNFPQNIKARLIYSESTKKHLYFHKKWIKVTMSFLQGSPTESELVLYINSSRIVICKSGFQQMVECLAMGAPVVVYDAPGGIPEIFLAGPMRKYVRYLPDRTSD